MEISVLQLHKKDVDVFDKIEDKVSINTANGSLAVSDGATQGFCSGIWADLVTREFTGMPVFNADNFCKLTLKNCAAKYSQKIDCLPVNGNKVMARLLDEKKKEGGYSTFIGLQFFKGRHIKVLCVGDSNLFYVVDRSIQSVPSSSLEELNSSSTFINSRYVMEDKVDQSIIKAFHLDVSKDGELFIVTDAIARYLFRYPDQFAIIKSIDNFEKLLAFAEEAWRAGILEQDDLTIVRISVDSDPLMVVRYIIPPDGFSFGNVALSMPEPYQSRIKQSLPVSANEKLISDLRIELSVAKKNTGAEIAGLKNELKNFTRHYALQANRTKSLVIVCAILLLSILGVISMYTGLKNDLKAAQERYDSDLYDKTLEVSKLKTLLSQATHIHPGPAHPITGDEPGKTVTPLSAAGQPGVATGGTGSKVRQPERKSPNVGQKIKPRASTPVKIANKPEDLLTKASQKDGPATVVEQNSSSTGNGNFPNLPNPASNEAQKPTKPTQTPNVTAVPKKEDPKPIISDTATKKNR